MKKILITTGGTGGHIFPALAVADVLTAKGVAVHWLGKKGYLEKKLIEPLYPVTYIAVQGLRGKGIVKKLIALWKLGKACMTAFRIMKHRKPDVVLGMGGYVSGPGSMAAWFARVPLIIHEQNSIPGMTNRLLAKIAASVLQAFPNTFTDQKAQTVGNPVRASLLSLSPSKGCWHLQKRPLRILVVGGSQGAYVINHTIANTLAQFEFKGGIAVWHQTGQHDFKTIKETYRKAQISVMTHTFIHNMDEAYGWADLVIARAGALTVSEIALVGIASILIPFPYAADNHQWYNARLLEKIGASITILQSKLSVKTLQPLLRTFMFNKAKLAVMANAARSMAKPNATREVVSVCEKYLNLNNT